MLVLKEKEATKNSSVKKPVTETKKLEEEDSSVSSLDESIGTYNTLLIFQRCIKH